MIFSKFKSIFFRFAFGLLPKNETIKSKLGNGLFLYILNKFKYYFFHFEYNHFFLPYMKFHFLNTIKIINKIVEVIPI